MLEAIVRHEFLALCAFACARSAEHEDDGHLVWRPEGGRARRCAEVGDGWHLVVSMWPVCVVVALCCLVGMRRFDASTTGRGVGARVADYRSLGLVCGLLLPLVDDFLEQEATECEDA